MDSITHIVLGACVGEALGGRKLGKKAMLFGAFANSVPDVDVITSFWMSQPDGLLAHRGFTHSFLFIFLLTPAFGWLMKKLFPKDHFSANEWSVLFGINMFLHIFIDAFTSYGTGWFEPFSHQRISFNVLFVADPFYTIPLLVTSVVLLLLKKNSRKRIRWTFAGLIISSLYAVYGLYHKAEVNTVTKQSLADEKIIYSDFITTPTPLNNFLWYIVAKNENGFNIGYYSVFDTDKQIHFHFMPINDSLMKRVKNDDDVKKLIRFSQDFYAIESINDTLVFNDLRFGQIGGWSSGDAPFVFQFKLARIAKNDVLIQRGRYQASSGQAFREMIERIKGN
jgi:inner membrane protein